VTRLLPFVELERGRPDERTILSVRSDKVRSEASGRELVVDRIACPDWVNVLALSRVDDEERLVLVRQWRFGSRSFTVEIPAGIVEPDEDRQAAALRELREETGHAPAPGSEVIFLGATQPNPAFMENELSTFLVPDAVRVAEPAPDGNEELEQLAWSVDEVEQRVVDGEIQSAMMLAALHRLRLWRAGLRAR
jgi:8-oxo-dGTP pyrophosphatase MutT (NUDIX family)